MLLPSAGLEILRPYLKLKLVMCLQERNRPGGRHHIPYRNSMMTTVLRDSLGGNCCTAMVATISPASDQLPEAIATCRFAQRVAQISNEVRAVACLPGCLALYCLQLLLAPACMHPAIQHSGCLVPLCSAAACMKRQLPSLSACMSALGRTLSALYTAGHRQ